MTMAEKKKKKIKTGTPGSVLTRCLERSDTLTRTPDNMYSYIRVAHAMFTTPGTEDGDEWKKKRPPPGEKSRRLLQDGCAPARHGALGGGGDLLEAILPTRNRTCHTPPIMLRIPFIRVRSTPPFSSHTHTHTRFFGCLSSESFWVGVFLFVCCCFVCVFFVQNGRVAGPR